MISLRIPETIDKPAVSFCLPTDTLTGDMRETTCEIARRTTKSTFVDVLMWRVLVNQQIVAKAVNDIEMA